MQALLVVDVQNEFSTKGLRAVPNYQDALRRIAQLTASLVLCILDLIVAPATALSFQARVLNIYPLALVPLFLGPPLGILIHILSLRNLAATSSGPSVTA